MFKSLGMVLPAPLHLYKKVEPRRLESAAPMIQLRRNPPKYPFRIHPPTEVGGFLRRRVNPPWNILLLIRSDNGNTCEYYQFFTLEIINVKVHRTAQSGAPPTGVGGFLRRRVIRPKAVI
jgi:hypothetical protein